MHVAEIDFGDFFRLAFKSDEACRAFIDCVEAIPAETSKAKIVIHQAARMLWLADRLDECAAGRPALQLLFHLIAAEAVAKMVKGFEGDGESRKHVRLFFEEICAERHREVLGRAFMSIPGGPGLSVREAADLLYDVRCDVVHEGTYFTFSLAREGDPTKRLTLNKKGDSLIASITIQEVRQIVLEGSVLGAQKLLPPGSRCAELAM